MKTKSKIILRELDSPLNLNSNVLEEVDYDEIDSEEESSLSGSDGLPPSPPTMSSATSTTSSSKLATKLCLCKLNQKNRVYASKHELIEIEFSTRLDSLNQGKTESEKPAWRTRNAFRIKYEFVDRQCHKLIAKSLRAKSNKAQLNYVPSSFGIQRELADLIDFNKVTHLIVIQAYDMNFVKAILVYFSLQI